MTHHIVLHLYIYISMNSWRKWRASMRVRRWSDNQVHTNQLSISSWISANKIGQDRGHLRGHWNTGKKEVPSGIQVKWAKFVNFRIKTLIHIKTQATTGFGTSNSSRKTWNLLCRHEWRLCAQIFYVLSATTFWHYAMPQWQCFVNGICTVLFENIFNEWKRRVL